jgi:RNA polymerase sigma-70 factor (ECF subfamily)
MPQHAHMPVPRNASETQAEVAPDEAWGLVARVRGGDDDAFETLMQRYKRSVLNFAYRMIGDAAEAEDVAQDVFVRAYRNMHKPGFRRTTAEFSTWLFAVARNAALDCLRRRKRRPTEPLSDLEDGGESLASGQATAAEVVAARETGAAIAAAVALLPEDQRTAVILSECEHRSDADIAAVMRCSPKSVEARLYRARRFLRERLRHLLPDA